MAETTIQWADYTFNPWIGCQRVSPGCEHCYAEAYDKRVGGVPVSQRQHAAAMISLGRALKPGERLLRWGPTAPRTRTSQAYWREPLKWNAAAKAAGQRRRVFCASLADVFEDRLELAPWRMELLDLIRKTPSLDWLLLTKRPERITKAIGAATCTVRGNNDRFDDTLVWLSEWLAGYRVPKNVWLGTTVEDQQRADERIPHLLAVPAAVYFLSCEPLLEAVKLRGPALTGVDWAIVGGESGGGARPFEVAWARSLVAQCRRAGIAPFVKQMGANVVDRNDAGFNGDDDEGWHSAVEYGGEIRVEDLDTGYQGAPVRVHLKDRAGGDPSEWPLDLRVREFPEVRR